jgi:aspartate carbamoyltransferase catalytic subunit
MTHAWDFDARGTTAYTPRMPSAAWDRKHLLQLEGMSAADLTELLERAEQHLPIARGESPRVDVLRGRTIANLFFEDSTRTRCSFTLAARRLGADTIDIGNLGSSVSKGETIVDTALNLQAMGVDAFVVRCAASGGALMIARAAKVPVINAGDGKHEHPTQGLLDILTLRQRLGKDLRGRTIAIVGDVVNSRVARSAMHGLTTLGANVILVGPPTLVPKSFEKIVPPRDGGGRVIVNHELDDILPEADSIMMLRVQFERVGTAAGGGGGPALISGDYRELYGLNARRLSMLPAHAVVLHPGPMNRGLEIDSEVADDPARSVILQQVTNGVAVRMAVLGLLVAGV